MTLFRKLVTPVTFQVSIRAASHFTKSAECIYKYVPTPMDEAGKFPHPSKEMKADFLLNGYVIVKSLLSSHEIQGLNPALLGDGKAFYDKLGFFRHDQRWGLVLWNEQGRDFLGKLAGNAKLAGVAEDLLDRGEIYLYHAKLLRKEAKQRGAAEWHQDYATMYHNELLFPDVISCTISLTQSDPSNGGTSVIKGSHYCGRVNHAVTKHQQGADPLRMDLIKRTLPQVDLEMAPGDAVFMHSNLLRHSGPNPSEHLRCHLKFVFNTKYNSPQKKHDFGDAVYTKLEKYPADALLENQDWEVETREWRQTEKEGIKSGGLDKETVWDL